MFSNAALLAFDAIVLHPVNVVKVSLEILVILSVEETFESGGEMVESPGSCMPVYV